MLFARAVAHRGTRRSSPNRQASRPPEGGSRRPRNGWKHGCIGLSTARFARRSDRAQNNSAAFLRVPSWPSTQSPRRTDTQIATHFLTTPDCVQSHESREGETLNNVGLNNVDRSRSRKTRTTQPTVGVFVLSDIAGLTVTAGVLPGPNQLMWIPEIAREMTSRCTSLVPSKMV